MAPVQTMLNCNLIEKKNIKNQKILVHHVFSIIIHETNKE